MKFFSKKFIFTKLKKGRAAFLRFQFTKQFIFVAVGVVVLVVGGILIFAVNDKGAPPVAYWKFDEGSASSTYDSSGNANTGTLYGGVQWANGVYGTGLQFDGANDYVDMASTISYADNTPWSVSFWAKPSVSLWSVFIGQSGGVDSEYLMFHTSNQIAFKNTSGNYFYSSSNAVILNEWHYYTIKVDNAGNMSFYRDGVFINTVDVVNSHVDFSRIGNGYIRYFSGLIDDIRIYNYARTADQIKNDYNGGKAMYVGAKQPVCDTSPADCVNKGLVGYWDMDQMTGTTATDKSGNGNTGTLGGGTASAVPIWTTGVQPFSGGKAGGGALSFDGVNDYVSAGKAENLNLTSNFTYSFWVKPILRPNSMTAIAKSAETAYGYNLNLSGTTNQETIWFLKDGLNTNVFFLGSTTTNNVWHFVAVTVDSIGTSVTLYVNGIEYPSMSMNKFASSSYQNLYIGSRSAGVTAPFNGSIDEVRIYNRVLSAAEIRYQYNQAKPIAWWKMDSVGVSGTPGAALNIYDNSGQGNTGVSSGETMNNGTITGATWKDGSNCKYGSCLSFDGSNDYVYSTNIDLLSSFSLGAWVYSKGSGGYIIDQEMGCVDYATYNLSITSDKAACRLYSSNSSGGKQEVISLTTLSQNRWYHLSCVYDTVANTLSVYIDGKADNSIAANSDSWNSTQLTTIGAGDSQGVCGDLYAPFNGLIDNVRIYNTALTATQVAALYNNNDRTAGASLEGNLVGEWRFDEMGTSYVADTHYQRIGKYGYAMNFDGSNDYVEIADNASLDPSNAITVSMWFRPDQTLVNYQGVLGKGGGLSFEKGYEFATNNDVFGFWINGSTNMAVTTKPASGELAFWVGTFDGTQIKLYKNGSLVNTVNYTATITDTNLPFRIGRVSEYGGNDEYTKGMYDDVRIYNYARTADQIRADYNAGSALHLGN